MDISAGIVLFNPDINRLNENISSIVVQCEHLYLVDNGSSNIETVKKMLKQFDDFNITLILNKKNMGIAKALNQITAKADDDGYKWILTLDQDSVAPNNIIQEFLKYTNKRNVGIICPVISDRNKGIEIYRKEGIIEQEECITSGALLYIDAWKKIGGFDESMFIDGVDFDICYRLRKHNFKILCVQNVILLHELGRIKYCRFLFWKVLVKNHSAFRKYYIARNTIYLARKKNSCSEKIRSVFKEIKLILIVLAYEDNKKEKIQRIICGIRDGLNMNISYK